VPAAALTDLRYVYLSMCYPGGPGNVLALLGWLRLQSRLETLCLRSTNLALSDLPDEAAAAAYASLTASNRLRKLSLDNMMPPASRAWQHMVPAGQLCTALTSLEIQQQHTHAMHYALPFRNNRFFERIKAACPGLPPVRWNNRDEPYWPSLLATD
jgi:hypothetical protein